MGLCDCLLLTHADLQSIQFLHQISLPISNNCSGRYGGDNRPSRKTSSWRCFSGGRSGGSRWDWEENVNSKQKSRFFPDDGDEEVEFGFRNATKQRIWWYDDFDAEEERDANDDKEDGGFGILEASIGFNWVFKVFQAFGWMIPAVIIYVVTGTGPNSIIMALALPLAQSAFSLVADTFFGRPDKPPRSKPKRRKRPFARASNRTRVRREKQMHNDRGKEGGNYKSWVDGNNLSDKDATRSMGNFGGWDELDNQRRVNTNLRGRNLNEKERQEK